MTAFTDSDYEALEAAVMETPRGRWFLGEYARRARAGDTQVLLEAIRRLERGMAGLNPPGGSADLVGELDALSQALGAAMSQAAAAGAAQPHDDVQHNEALGALTSQLEAIKARLDGLIGAERPGGDSVLTRDNLSFFGGDEDLFHAGGEAAAPATASSPSLSLVDGGQQRDSPQQPAAASAEGVLHAGEPDPDKERIVFIRRASSDQSAIPLADEPDDAQDDSRPAHGG